MKLTADNVRTIVKDCLFTDEEIKQNNGQTPADAVLAEGIMTAFGFNKSRLESHRDDVASMLAELPDDFHEGKGGGMSFLNACMTRDGEHWGEQPTMDELFVLGMGLGLVSSLMPRPMWKILPGGMPYYVVKKT